VIDLSGCSKLECLGDFCSLRSLQRLDLSDRVSLRSMPNLSHCCLLEVLVVTGCHNLMFFLRDVWDLSMLVRLLGTVVSGNRVVLEMSKYTFPMLVVVGKVLFFFSDGLDLQVQRFLEGEVEFCVRMVC
jgi:hypothetical protein